MESNLILNEDHFSANLENDNQNTEMVSSTESQLESAINNHIKLLRKQTDDAMKKKLVIKICELRIKLNQLTDSFREVYVLGHKLSEINDLKGGSCFVCDHCRKKQKMSIKLFNINTENYLLICQYCGVCIHQKCQHNLTRSCPRLSFESSTSATIHALTNDYVILSISPEIGLLKQQFRCQECKIVINFENSRICDYDGRYYCRSCHWGESDSIVIPARLIHNWDQKPRPVSRASLQIINYIKFKPVLFNITQLNSMLYGLVDELAHVKRVRTELCQMVKYIRLCKQPDKPKINISNYYSDEDSINSYSLEDLCNLTKLFITLYEAHKTFMNHITKECQGCIGKGFFCELCRDREDILFPFSNNIAICSSCSAVYHKNCFYRNNTGCPRCERIKAKKEQNEFNQ